jgi:uncharacterized protein YlxW (UPF0749 family)
MIASLAFGLELQEWALLITGVFVAAEITGFSRSGRTARKDNADLRERNATLEGEVKTLEEKAASLQLQIAALVRQVDDLKERNVDALWSAYREHDQRVTEGHAALGSTLTLLSESITLHEEQAQGRHGAMLVIMERIADKVDGTSTEGGR